jgi:hypothetical protein
MLLLPVAIVLAIMGALAFSMTRQGAVSVAEVDRQYDLEASRYLAEAGLRLVRWQNEKEGCTSSQAFTGVGLPGMAGTVTITELLVKSGEMTMTATATGPLGSVSSARREKIEMYDRKTLLSMTIPDADGDDIYIKVGMPKQAGTVCLEASDGAAHSLIKFGLGKLVDHSRVGTAELSLHETLAGTGMQRTLAVHRVTRDWKDDDSTWTFPWTSAGGDYQAVADAVAAINPAGGPDAGRYVWRVDSLVRSWIDGKYANFGVLFKPSNMNGTRFGSLEYGTATQRPRLKIGYYLRCA